MIKKKFLGFAMLSLIIGLSACSNVNEPETPDTSIKVPYSESFETGLGKFTTQNVNGAQVWEQSSQYKYVSITGYVDVNNDGVKENVANEDWLISPEISLANVTAAKLTFDHVARYFADVKTEATVWVSENYKEGLPATATWQQLTTPAFKNASSWDLATSGEISLTAFAGKKIRIAFKYVSTDTKAGTWEVKNFKVQEGEAAVIPGGNTVDPAGSGTEASPYNVPAAIANQGASKWVEGYIVGNVDGQGMSITSESKFVAPFTIATNVLIAATATETDYTKCIPVQLPSGAIRTGLNLVDHAANLGKKVKLYGSLEVYFTVPGIKSTSYYELEGGTTGGSKPTDTSNALLSETLLTQASFDKFTKVSVAGDQAWTFSASYGATMSGFANNVSYANEDWFISPALDLTGKTSVKLTFDHARGPAGSINVGVSEGYYSVWVTNNYTSGAPSTATWTELTGVVHGTAAWGYVSSGALTIPTANLKANARIAFKYKSIDGASATWEVKNVVLK
jgi:hypothetical protein